VFLMPKHQIPAMFYLTLRPTFQISCDHRSSVAHSALRSFCERPRWWAVGVRPVALKKLIVREMQVRPVRNVSGISS
jgi:hypothetical protein